MRRRHAVDTQEAPNHRPGRHARRQLDAKPATNFLRTERSVPRAEGDPPHRHVWRITRHGGDWPRWPLIEDMEADDFVIENGGRQLVLYRDELVVLTARRVVVARLDVRDVAAVERM
jgi:hypothetical protein